MTSFWQDVRYSLRMIAKAPGYAAIAILTLALGIGANTTIFSWINSTLLNPIPGLANPQEVVALSLSRPSESPFLFTYPDVVAMRDGQRSFSGITANGTVPMSLTGNDKPERIWGTVATANYFTVLGVRLAAGRGFLPAEDEKPGGAPVAVISYRLWQTHFAANPDIVGHTIEINQRPYTIVGVAPALFQGSQTGLRSEIWVPIMMVQQLMEQGDLVHDHHYFWMSAMGRLKPGVAPQQAQEEMTLRLKREVTNYPEEHKGHEIVTAYPLWRSPFSVNQIFSMLLPMLMSIAGFVLLLACANVANLMLVRSVARRREIAIRMSLGASRWRLVRQSLIESLMLALAGGAAAWIITLWTAGSLMKFLPVMDFPVSLVVRTDRTVLLATLGISVLTGVLFGILPALRSSGEAPVGVLKEDAGSVSSGLHKARLTSGLVVAQISLSLLLLICAGLFIRSFLSAQQINPGFSPHNVLIASYDLFTAGYSAEAGREFDRQVAAKLEALPGIQSVALSSRVPLGFPQGSTSIKMDGYVSQANESMETQDTIVSPNYFKTMQIPILKGRDFTLRDKKDSQRVVVVSEAFVDRYWPHQEAIGKRVFSDLTHEWFTVVGVARDSKATGLNDNKPKPFLYLPLDQVYQATMIVNARVLGDPMASGTAVEKAIHELNPALVVFDVADLEARWQIASFQQRIAGTFVGAFGLLALILATVGVYGVTSYTTRQRVHEIGIRIALGASKEDVLRLVLGQGLRLTLVGVGLGLAAAFGLTRFLKSMLLGVTSTDALTFFTVAVLLCAVALLACFIPALRALRVDPMVALRHE
jgi:predicted permease